MKRNICRNPHATFGNVKASDCYSAVDCNKWLREVLHTVWLFEEGILVEYHILEEDIGFEYSKSFWGWNIFFVCVLAEKRSGGRICYTISDCGSCSKENITT